MRKSTDRGRTFDKLRTIIDAVDFPPWKGANPESANDKGNAVWDVRGCLLSIRQSASGFRLANLDSVSSADAALGSRD